MNRAMRLPCLSALFLLSCADPAVDRRLPLKPPKHGGVYVVAHRGAHNNIPENTLAAYRKAIELGCDFVEIDVRTTKDGRFVSIHNREIDRYVTNGATGAVKDLTLAELKALDIGSRVDPKWKDERIPTFEEILDLCRGRIGIYLDLKEAPLPPLVDMVRARGMEHEVLWYIGGRQVSQLRDLCSECIAMPDPGPEASLPALLAATRPRVIAAVWRHYSASFVKTCHAAGAIVIVDEADPSSWKPALAWGTDGIQTDHPAELIEYLKTRGSRSSD